MDIVSGLIGSSIGMLLLYIFSDILICTPGYFIYCIFFTKAEYDPDHKHDVDVGDIRILAIGIAFWLVVIGLVYGIYRAT
ncbi:MAG: hypothetical protein PHH47_03010 [Gallionella sp.]|nr:hypothetical protein [Gallionella sp.]MDD4945847.1 hypothetical protein [Gallionella sp.]MDD5613436.1 hypothetical protein [Gallionella sp.]